MKSRRRKKERKKKKNPKTTHTRNIYINLKKCGKKEKEKEKVCKQLPVFPGGHPSKY